MEINKIFILGKLTKPVTLRQAGSSQVGVINLLVEAYKDNKQGDPFVERCYIDVDTWGKAALNACETLRPGDYILVTGRLKSSSWKDSKGENRVKHTIYCENYELQDPTMLEPNIPVKQAQSVQEVAQQPVVPQRVTQPVVAKTNPQSQPRPQQQRQPIYNNQQEDEDYTY